MMSEEMKKKEKIDCDKMEQVNGGLVVSYKNGNRNLVINDNTGRWSSEVSNDLDLAKRKAQQHGYSDNVVHVDSSDAYDSWCNKSGFYSADDDE